MKKLIITAAFLVSAFLSCNAQTIFTSPFGEKCWVLWKFKNAEDTVVVVLVDQDLKTSDYLILRKLPVMGTGAIKSQASRWTTAGKRVEVFPYRKEEVEERKATPKDFGFSEK